MAGRIRASFTVIISNNDIFESNKDFILDIDPFSLTSGVIDSNPFQATVTIVDDDCEYLDKSHSYAIYS